MKKNRTGTKKFPALILFLFGFLAGNLIPNIIWKAKWQQKTWASVYFLSTFAGKNTGNIEYLKEILKYRGVFYLLNIICGFSVFGAPLAVFLHSITLYQFTEKFQEVFLSLQERIVSGGIFYVIGTLRSNFL